VLKIIIKEPLAQFAVIALVLFAGTKLWMPIETKTTTLVVDKETLEKHLQYQANAFSTGKNLDLLNLLTPKEQEQLAADYIRDEVLYREAKSLALDSSDYIIRQRMIDKMRFLLADIGLSQEVPLEEELSAWLEANADLYREPAYVTFAHVFFSTGANPTQKIQQDSRASKLLAELNESHADFNAALGLGDNFPFLKQYVERSYDYIQGHFGAQFAKQIAVLTPSDQWLGPIESVYGQHLVLIRQQQPSRMPNLDEVRADVLRDLFNKKREDTVTLGVQRLLENKYELTQSWREAVSRNGVDDGE
jgi:peptidyl-prolyl cis-trans isomerase C